MTAATIEGLREAAKTADRKVLACRAAVREAEANLEKARQESMAADRALIEAETRAELAGGQP